MQSQQAAATTISGSVATRNDIKPAARATTTTHAVARLRSASQFQETDMANTNQQGGNNQGTSNRGFASMDDDKQREIAAEGGRAAHEKGTAHEFDSREAREAGRKGGEAVSQDREHMSEIGRMGGEARGGASNSDRDQQGGGNRGGSNR
jgi:general stress protein YciG